MRPVTKARRRAQWNRSFMTNVYDRPVRDPAMRAQLVRRVFSPNGYLKQYSWRNASAGDFLDSVGSAANPAVTGAFSTFLDQPGVPLVSVKLNCDTPDHASLQLTQRRALPLGTPGSRQQTWQIPVCVRYGEGDATQRECTLMTQA